jgi:RNA polymerase sigma-70 factor (ECF subfamily)
MTGVSEAQLLAAFDQHKNELRLHCYRMLGSSHDSDDMLQEAAVRAWRSHRALADTSSVRAWLYRIVTNVCLDELSRRRSRCLPFEAGPAAADPTAPIAPPEREAWIEPCPDAWLEASSNPGARYEQREHVALAFVAALQHLTPLQRATLLLRDVVGFSAEETARALELGLEATNSALFRARAAVQAKLAGRKGIAPSPDDAALLPLLTRYLDAWNRLDLEAFVNLLHEEVRTTMPPSPTWIAGRDANVRFYTPMFTSRRPGSFAAIPMRSNAQAAFAFYRPEPAGGPHLLRAIQLVEICDGAISAIDHLLFPELGPIFGLAAELDEHFSPASESHECIVWPTAGQGR